MCATNVCVNKRKLARLDSKLTINSMWGFFFWISICSFYSLFRFAVQRIYDYYEEPTWWTCTFCKRSILYSVYDRTVGLKNNVCSLDKMEMITQIKIKFRVCKEYFAISCHVWVKFGVKLMTVRFLHQFFELYFEHCGASSFYRRKFSILATKMV